MSKIPCTRNKHYPPHKFSEKVVNQRVYRLIWGEHKLLMVGKWHGPFICFLFLYGNQESIPVCFSSGYLSCLTFTGPCFWLHSPTHVAPTGPILLKHAYPCPDLVGPTGPILLKRQKHAYYIPVPTTWVPQDLYLLHSDSHQKHSHLLHLPIILLHSSIKLLEIEESILRVWSIFKISLKNSK